MSKETEGDVLELSRGSLWPQIGNVLLCSLVYPRESEAVTVVTGGRLFLKRDRLPASLIISPPALALVLRAPGTHYY